MLLNDKYLYASLGLPLLIFIHTVIFTLGFLPIFMSSGCWSFVTLSFASCIFSPCLWFYRVLCVFILWFLRKACFSVFFLSLDKFIHAFFILYTIMMNVWRKCELFRIYLRHWMDFFYIGFPEYTFLNSVPSHPDTKDAERLQHSSPLDLLLKTREYIDLSQRTKKWSIHCIGRKRP